MSTEQRGAIRVEDQKMTFQRLNRLLLVAVVAAMCFVPPCYAHRRHRHGNGLACSKCAPGFVVIRPCGHGLDTECTPCQSGQYMPHHSHRRHCFPCSRCGGGLFEAHPCTPSSDTLCDSCHTVVKGPHSQDFYLKCVNASSSTESKRKDEDDFEPWDIEDSPNEVLLVSSSAFSHMRHEDRPVPLVHQLRPHHQKTASSHRGGSSLSFGAGSAGVITAVVSLSVVFGLILAVVLSRWRSTSQVPDRNKLGYVVVAQAAESCSAV